MRRHGVAQPETRGKAVESVPDLIARLTIEEKASLCSGLNMWELQPIDRLGVPSIMLTNGPFAVQKQVGEADFIGLNQGVPATCFPTGSALGATWNRDLIFEVGKALGEECRLNQVGVLLGPGINIKRSPLGGRNFEYFSEDPFLVGELAAQYIRGVQSQEVGTSLKHFAANNQETRRMSINAVIDERALREIYLAGFETAVRKAQPWTVMCAYNQVNGAFCSENRALMTDILRGEWGFEGAVVTDWGATVDRVVGLKAGIDLEMPGPAALNTAQIVSAIASGQLEEGVLDGAVERVLTLIHKAKAGQAQDFTCDMQAHHTLARRAAAEGIVLLRNEQHTLPIATGAKVALIGRYAKYPRFQGSGSSFGNPTQLESLYDEFCFQHGASNVVYTDGYPENGQVVDPALIQQAIEAASGADVAVLCVGTADSEGLDRHDMTLTASHTALIEQVTAAHPNVVLVLCNGAPVELPWVNHVSAIVEAYLGGQAGGGALADILLGKFNPSGKLAETFPIRLEDNPSHRYFPGGPSTVEYRESLYVGYRYYDHVAQDVCFPFGHGLSYTRFEYRDLRLRPFAQSTDVTVEVTFRIRNSGEVPGKEIAQIYVRDVESSWFRPVKELKGFIKLALDPGEEQEVTVSLDRRAFSCYDPIRRAWVMESGDFEVLVGASSRDIRLKGVISLSSAQAGQEGNDAERLPDYAHYSKDVPVSDASFAALLGRPIPANRVSRKGSHTLDTPLIDMQDSWVGRLMMRMIKRQANKMLTGANDDAGTAALIDAVLTEMPLRNLAAMSNGALSHQRMQALLLLINGHYRKGLLAFVRPPHA
ncbi:MAG: glycoside hydrolase family 3 C-terminal domain-containing protein [Anaerolineae bacterium]